MECSECGANLMISNSKLVTEVGSTEIFSELTMLCINPKCDSYSGKDLNNPLKVAETLKRKVG